MENIAKKRGRPAGSKNIQKSTGGIEVLKFEKYVSNTLLTKKSGQGWVNWGLKNDMPTQLLSLYNQSPTHAAAINFGVQSICSGGIDYEAMKLDSSQTVPNYEYSWDELIRNISLDFMLYGSFSIEIIMNKDGKTFSFWHIPLEKVRWSEYDEDGQITSYWISNDWSMTGQYPPIEIEAFDMRPDTKIEKGKPYLYVYRHYSPTMNYYTAPHYASAIKAIQAEIEFLEYELKHVVNGFNAAGVLTLPECETDEQKRAIINNIQNMFQGSSNNNQIAIAFRTNLEDSPVQWTPFSDKGSNVDQYSGSNQRTINRILAAHQVNDPQLIGLPNPGGTGFNSEGRLLETAYNVYNKVVGNYNRNCVIKTINQMFRMNGIDVEIIMKPLVFSDVTTDNVSTSSESNKDADEKELTEKNVEEKVEQ